MHIKLSDRKLSKPYLSGFPGTNAVNPAREPCTLLRASIHFHCSTMHAPVKLSYVSTFYNSS